MKTFNELFESMIYMNLDKRTDRRVLAEKEFESLEISPVRMPGVFIKGAPNQAINDALGCMFAHIECLKYGLESDSNVFIFEDDIKFVGNNIKQNINMACAELDELDWDMFYLCANILKPCYQVTDHLAKLTHAQNTAGYGVNKKFIKKLLEYLPLDFKIGQIWIDVIYADTVVPNNNCYVSIPMMGVQREGWSDIMNANMRYEDYMLERYWTNLVKKEI
jgi:GR25 family glycosyltransferase involved in LPS biosynthesis